jgi:hypothetical protein
MMISIMKAKDTCHNKTNVTKTPNLEAFFLYPSPSFLTPMSRSPDKGKFLLSYLYENSYT